MRVLVSLSMSVDNFICSRKNKWIFIRITNIYFGRLFWFTLIADFGKSRLTNIFWSGNLFTISPISNSNYGNVYTEIIDRLSEKLL